MTYEDKCEVWEGFKNKILNKCLACLPTTIESNDISYIMHQWYWVKIEYKNWFYEMEDRYEP